MFHLYSEFCTPYGSVRSVHRRPFMPTCALYGPIHTELKARHAGSTVREGFGMPLLRIEPSLPALVELAQPTVPSPSRCGAQCKA